MSVPQKEIEEGRDEEEQILGGAMMISSVLSSLSLSLLQVIQTLSSETQDWVEEMMAERSERGPEPYS
jgi:hypothetical protein